MHALDGTLSNLNIFEDVRDNIAKDIYHKKSH